MTRTVDPYDELATMFLSPPARGEQRPALAEPITWPSAMSMNGAKALNSQAAPAAELLLVGHLPVRAGLWLTPYVDAVARERGCTALLRLDGDEPTVQVLRSASILAAPPHGTAIEQTLMKVAPHIDHWVVRAGGEIAPADILACGADRVTILSSGDEVAVVAAYEIIRGLANEAQQGDAAVPTVELAIVGCERPVADEIVDRLNRTTVSFLGVEVKLALCLSRMDAGVKSSCYMSCAGQRCPSLADAMSMIDRARSGSRRQSAEPAVIGRLHADRGDSSVSRAEDILRRPFAQPAARPAAREPRLAIVEPPAPPASSAPVLQSQAPMPIKLPPKPAVNVEAKQMRQPHEPCERGQPLGLAQHIAGLNLLPLRMPGHESVELAVDAAGRLHVLGREAMLRELGVVEHWAASHREILAMACPQFAAADVSDVTCHVFTDQPATLADLHGTDLFLHVLAPVTVGGQTGWYSAPLNTP